MSDHFNSLIAEAFDDGLYSDCRSGNREYTTFLGMAVRGFDCNLSWNSGSTLDLSCYDDECGDVMTGDRPMIFEGHNRRVEETGDAKNPYRIVYTRNSQFPTGGRFRMEEMIGSPFRFAMNNFEFCGLLQGIDQSESENGERSWRVQLKSPEELVNNIHLILGGYNETLTLDNIINLGLIVEHQKSGYLNAYYRLQNWTENVYAAIVKRSLYLNQSMYAAHRNAKQGTRDAVAVLRNFEANILASMRPTIHESLYYNEIVWAFSKYQSERALRFNHHAADPNTNWRFPDIIVDKAFASEWNGRYYVDLSELPGNRNSTIPYRAVPKDYRIGGGHITLDKLVKDVCDEEGFRLDYQWELRQSEVRRLENHIAKLTRVINAKNQAAANNQKDPFINISLADIQNEIAEVQAWANSIPDDVQYRLPVIKLKVSPQGLNADVSSARKIIEVTDYLRSQGVPINNRSAGMEKGDDMPSVLMNGGNKEVIVTAAPNLFGHRSYRTGNPFNNWEAAIVTPPDSYINPTTGKRQNEHPSVWKMYFGQDRYNCPQVMFTEKVLVPEIRTRLTPPALRSEGAPPIHQTPTLRKTLKFINYVFLDTLELKSALRFFVGNDDIPEWHIPDYIKVSENELRASVNYDLFWSSVCITLGDLYKVFIKILDPIAARNAMFFKGTSSTMPEGSSPYTEQQEQLLMAQLNMFILNRFAVDSQNTSGRIPVRQEKLEMIFHDFQKIQDWVNQKRTQYYGKHYVTPFYFDEVVEIYDENGSRKYSYEPQILGFREYGGTDFLGLLPGNPLWDNIRGLETFMTPDGRVQAFARFFDPLQEYALWPPRDASGNIIKNGYGNGIAPSASIDPSQVYQETQPLIYKLYKINTDNLDVHHFTRNDSIALDGTLVPGAFFYCKIASVDRIKNGNLIHIELAENVFEYQQAVGASTRSGNINEELMAEFYENATEDGIPEQMLDRRYQAIYDRLSFSVGMIDGSYVTNSLTPKAAVPIDGCYGVKCNFIHYGPWILRNGTNPGKYEVKQELTPWTFGSQMGDPEVAHQKMNSTGLMYLSAQMTTHRYAHIVEQGKLTVAGYPAIKVGSEIGSLMDQGFPVKKFDHYNAVNFLGQATGVTNLHGALVGSPHPATVTFANGILSVITTSTFAMVEVSQGHWQHIGGFTVDFNFDKGFKTFYIRENPFTGLNGPNVSRITVNVQDDGGITTTYNMNKHTMRDGMMSKLMIDRIQRSTAFTREYTREYTRMTMEEVKRIVDDQNRAYKAFIKRNSEDYGAGRRTNVKSPHQMLMSQNIQTETFEYIDPQTGRRIKSPFIRNLTQTGQVGVEVVQTTQTNSEYLQKSFVSLDALFSPYATTGIEEGVLLEIEYRRRIAEITGDTTFNPTLAEQDLRLAIQQHGTMNIPVMAKPRSNAAASVADGPRFLTREALRDFNEGKSFDDAFLVPSVPINSLSLNPLVNPAQVDDNPLMMSAAGRKSNSTLGHVTTAVAKGLTTQDSTSFSESYQPENPLQPYSPHYRSLGIKAPIIVTGWGWDTEGKPVPRDAQTANWFSKDWAARQDQFATGPLDIRFDRDRGVWTIPTPRMFYVVMLEDMKIRDVTAINEQERVDFDRGYEHGAPRGRSDQETMYDNMQRSEENQLPYSWYWYARQDLPPQKVVNGNFVNGYRSNTEETEARDFRQGTEALRNGFIEGWEHGMHNIQKPKRIPKPDKIVYGEAKILNAKDRIEGFINVVSITGAPLRRGDQVFVYQDTADDAYYAMPTAMSLMTGTVTRRIEPTGDLDEVNNELRGGGWVLLENGESVRAYCGMVTDPSMAIPTGSLVEMLSISGRMNIINRLC